MSLREYWIWREVPAVRLICPKPEPYKVLAGRPMLTRRLTSCQGSNCLAPFSRKCLEAATGCETIDRSKKGQANVNAIVLRPESGPPASWYSGFRALRDDLGGASRPRREAIAQK
jgi:hypothetical protein